MIFFIIKLYSNIENEIQEESLIFALNYVYTNLKCDIINISLAIPMIEDINNIIEMNNICDKLFQKNVAIISSFDNLGSLSYPACFESVIGVTSDPLCSKVNDFIYIDDKYINIAAKGTNESVASLNGKIVIASGNSIACAHASGIISNFIKKEMIINELKNELKNKTTYPIKCYVNNNIVQDFNKSNFINTRAVVFPFNKEIHSIVSFEDLLICNLVDVFNLKHSGLIGKNISDLLPKFSRKDFIIKNIEEINYNSFDTLILGHVSELILIPKIKHKIQDLIENCIGLNKNIYSFDDIEKIFNFNYDNYYSPEIKRNYFSENAYGKLFRIPQPILGVFGTSSHQGKFTLQLLLRRMFIQNGYNVGQIGTEPSSYLFDMDDCFHFGYNSNNYIVRYNRVAYFNSILDYISKKDVDIIISGCQSRTIPTDNGNLNDYTLNQIEYLLSLQPDVVVLVVNSWDDIEYIKRTISFIESAVVCKVIGLVMYPYKMIYDFDMEIYENKGLESIDFIEKKLLEKLLKIPIYSFKSEEEVAKLFINIINYLSQNDELYNE